mgnify:CR=1 FL=1|jgi:hypothetical protein
MSRTYALPQKVALALSTNRIEFLAGMTDEEFRSSDWDYVQLLRDLINDRVVLEQRAHEAADCLKHADAQLTAARLRWDNLWNDLHDLVDDEENEEPKNKKGG